MKSLSNVKHHALAMLLGCSVGTATAQEFTEPTAEELSAQAEYEQYLDNVTSIGNDRHGAIAGIVAMWSPNYGQFDGWEAEFTSLLESASEEQLYNIQNASSYDAVRAILQGRSEPVSLEGVTGTEDLGDRTEDLVYAPVFPCRIFDTRVFLGAGNPPPNGATLNYYVHGGSTLMTPQGGNSAGCFAPKGEPVGVSINLAAVPTSSVGHLRIYPFGTTRPNASFLNYFGGGNIANSGIITSTFGTGRDISVFHRNVTHAFADVMGYFYPAQQRFPSRIAFTTSSATANATPSCKNLTSLLVTIPPDGGFVEVEAEVNVQIRKVDATNEDFELFLGRTSTDCSVSPVSGDGYYYGFWRVPAAYPNTLSYNRVPVARLFNENGTGSFRTVRYYLNTRGTDGAGSDLVWPWGIGMKAVYSAN